MNTARLILRPVDINDWSSLMEIFRDFENSEYKNFDFPLPTEPLAVKELASRWAAEKKYFAMVLAETEEMVGYICYHGTDIPDIGYALKKRFQRNGYAYEAVREWIEQSQFDTFTAGVALGNKPSVTLLEKLGFKLAKTESMIFRKDDNGQDIVCDCGIFEYRKINLCGGKNKMDKQAIEALFEKYIKKLRITPSWDIRLELVEDPSWPKTGDFKIDCSDRKAILLLNVINPKQANLEEVIIHELMHIKMYPLDQVTESLITNCFEEGSKASNFAYQQFFTTLEQTVEELAKCFLLEFGDNKELSFGRCSRVKSFNELYDGLKPIE